LHFLHYLHFKGRKMQKVQKVQKVQSKNLIRIMAHYRATTGFEDMTGAISKRKVQGVNELSITRHKHYRDPLTGEVVDEGPKEMYIQRKRDLKEHPLSENEKRNRGDWSKACNEALAILRDKNHPRRMELYNRWRAQLSAPNHYKQFQGYVKAVLKQEQTSPING